jgi:glycosyltransferase involved in cell wall biosynthesis
MEPKISLTIITVTYNCEANLENTIRSIKNQNDKNYEYIIIDGASSDKTLEIIEKYKDSIDQLISEKDDGIYDAMNKGVTLASGEWILFMNSGDTFANNDVLSTVKNHIATTDASIVYGNIWVKKQETRLLRVASEPCNKHRMFFCHQSAFTKSSLLKQFPFDKRFKMSSDYHFTKRCFYKGIIFKHINLAITNYDLNGISNTNRITGLYENIQIVHELDSGIQKIIFLLRLYFVILRIKITN